MCNILRLQPSPNNGTLSHVTPLLRVSGTGFASPVMFCTLFSVSQFSSRWYLCAQKSPYVPYSFSQKFPLRCLWNSSIVRLIDDGPVSSFHGRFLALPLVQLMVWCYLALCLQMVSQTHQHFRSSEKQTTCEGCFARQSICSVISLHSGMSKCNWVYCMCFRLWPFNLSFVSFSFVIGWEFYGPSYLKC